MKKIILLGSTGSIGRSTLAVVRALRDRLAVVGLAAERSYRRMLDQAAEFGVRRVAVADEAAARKCAAEAPAGVQVLAGEAGLEELAGGGEADAVVCAVVGMAGLRPVLAALKSRRDVALATKEVLVAAGGIVTEACRRHGGRLLPVDSEHSAVFQCLQGNGGERTGKQRNGETEKRGDGEGEKRGNGETGRETVKRLILTASGGPFALQAKVDFDRVTVEEALRHPSWNMGKKVTVDSATLMNKGLEVMEAHWLFGVPVDRIQVVVHPESVVHSLVEFVDGAMLAQLSVPDMRLAIQYALTYPERVAGGLPSLDLVKVGPLRFFDPDPVRFPCLRLAREAAQTGGTMPCVLSAANEVAVGNFLEGRIPFSGIWRAVEAVMSKHETTARPGIEDVLAADRWARQAAQEAEPWKV